MAKSKVDDDWPAGFVHQNIGALEVFVGDVAGERVEGVDDLKKGTEEADEMAVLPGCSVGRSRLGIEGEDDISDRVSVVSSPEIIA